MKEIKTIEEVFQQIREMVDNVENKCISSLIEMKQKINKELIRTVLLEIKEMEEQEISIPVEMKYDGVNKYLKIKTKTPIFLLIKTGKTTVSSGEEWLTVKIHAVDKSWNKEEILSILDMISK